MEKSDTWNFTSELALLACFLVWDVLVLLYTVTMCFYYQLMNKADTVNDQAEYTQAGNQNKDWKREKAESETCHEAPKGVTCQGITSKPQPRGDTQINRNGLIYKRELASKKPKTLAKQL